MIEVFSRIDEDGKYVVKDEFREVITIKYLPQGTVLHAQGEPLKKNYYIIKGIARCYMYKNDKDITTYFAIDNTPIAAIDVLHESHQKSLLNIELLENSIVAEMQFEKSEI
jgi:CRP-like cAMP-binding protein